LVYILKLWKSQIHLNTFDFKLKTLKPQNMRAKLKCKLPVGPKAPRRSAISRSKGYGPSVLLLRANKEPEIKGIFLEEAQQIQDPAIKALEELDDVELISSD
jgi:hypothetical protein